MICPYCKSELYQSDVNQPATLGGLVNIYECEWENKQFIVHAGRTTCSNGFGTTLDITTGEKYATVPAIKATTTQDTNGYGKVIYLVGIADKNGILYIKNYYGVPQFTMADALYLEKCLQYDIDNERCYFNEQEQETLRKADIEL
jgi:hypothetical protein